MLSLVKCLISSASCTLHGFFLRQIGKQNAIWWSQWTWPCPWVIKVRIRHFAEHTTWKWEILFWSVQNYWYVSFFIIINTKDNGLLDFCQKIIHIFKLRLGKENSVMEENPTAAAWILVAVGMSAEMLIVLPFWWGECFHFPGRSKKYIVKIGKLFYEISSL